MTSLISIRTNYTSDSDAIIPNACSFESLLGAMWALATYRGLPESADMVGGQTFARISGSGDCCQLATT